MAGGCAIERHTFPGDTFFLAFTDNYLFWARFHKSTFSPVVYECKALEKRKGQTMNDFEWVIEKDGNVICSKITNPATGVTTARDHHGNTLGY